MVNPKFAYPKPLSKSQRAKLFANSDDDSDGAGYYQFAEGMDVDGNDLYTCDDYELPMDPPPVTYPKRPKLTMSYPLRTFLRQFCERSHNDINLQQMPSIAFKRREKEKASQMKVKSDDELIEMSACERLAYFEKVKNYKLSQWNVMAPRHCT